jgi:hypothetical protein
MYIYMYVHREESNGHKEAEVEGEERPPNSEDLLLFSPKEMDQLEDTDEKWVGRYDNDVDTDGDFNDDVYLNILQQKVQ